MFLYVLGKLTTHYLLLLLLLFCLFVSFFLFADLTFFFFEKKYSIAVNICLTIIFSEIRLQV